MTTIRNLLAGAAACTLLAACGSQQPENVKAIEGGSTSGAAAAGDATNVSGPAIRIVGSSTVYPFTTAVAEQFKRRFAQAETPIVESTGTGGGIKLFCAGVGTQHPDIVNASRRIKRSELDLCAKNGVTDIVEVQVGVDGIVLAEAGNAPDVALEPKDIFLALAATRPDGKPNTARTWADADPGAPKRKIEVLGPPPTSGTRDAFNELIMEAGCKTFPALKALKDTDEAAYKTACTKVREDGAYVEAGENDNLIVQKLVGNPTAFGIFGYSYLEENLDKIKPVPLGGVMPTYENIASFKYPASRPLYIYVKAQHAAAKPALKAFVAEYAKESTWGPNGYLKGRGLVPAPDAIRAKAAAAAAAMTPTDFADVK